MDDEKIKEIWNSVHRKMEFQRIWSLIDQADKDSMLSIARSYVLEFWRDAHIIYQDNGNGKPSFAAIGIGKSFYNDYNQLSKNQPAIQLITEWKRFSDVALQHDTETWLWFDAYVYARDARARQGQEPPEWDYHTTRRIRMAEEQFRKTLFQ